MENSRNNALVGIHPPMPSILGIFSWIMCILLITLSPQRAHAQYYDITDVKQLGFSVSVPDIILMEGETVEAVVSIGSVGSPVRGAVGFEIWVDVGDNGIVVPTLAPDMAGSWLASAMMPSESRTLGSVTRYTYTYVRGVPTDGSGMVLRLHLKASKNYVNANTIIMQAGGMILIDNLELRTSGPRPVESAGVAVWPNPASANARSVQVRCSGQPALALSLYNLDGQLMGKFDPMQPMDLTSFAAGAYLLHVVDAAGRTLPQKLILQQ
jgi:hypothetical protein